MEEKKRLFQRLCCCKSIQKRRNRGIKGYVCLEFRHVIFSGRQLCQIQEKTCLFDMKTFLLQKLRILYMALGLVVLYSINGMRFEFGQFWLYQPTAEISAPRENVTSPTRNYTYLQHEVLISENGRAHGGATYIKMHRL